MRKWVVAVLCLLALAGCGGDSGSSENNPFRPDTDTGGSTDPGPTDPGTPADAGDPRLARMAVAASQYTVRSDNSDAATLTVTALDQSNAALQGVPIAVRATAGWLNAAKTSTDADGNAVFTFRAGPERTNQVVTVTFTSGRQVKTIPIQIVGTSLSLDASKTSVLLNDSQGVVLTGQVRDAAGIPLFGQEVSLTSAGGNLLYAMDPLGRPVSGSLIAVATDVNGGFRATYTGQALGADTVSVRGCGVQKDVVLTVKDTTFGFVTPQETSIPEGSAIDLLVRWENGSGPLAGETLNVTASHGHFAAESAPGQIQVTTDAQGQATIRYLASDLAAPATIQVTSLASGMEDFLALNVLAVNTNRLDLQAFPDVVPPRAGTSTPTAAVVATVRDASNNPVQGALVNFQLLAGPGGGEGIFPVAAYTDASGQATTTFTAGSLTSAQNGIRIRATTTAYSDDVELTIGQKAARVVIGTTNELEIIERDGLEVAFGMPVTVLVTDNNGNPIAGQRVTLGLYPLRHETGYWIRVLDLDGLTVYSEQVVTGTFANEDLNRNGILDAGEDGAIGRHLGQPAYYLNFDRYYYPDVLEPLPSLPAAFPNLNHRLDPGNVASIPTEVITDENGLASYKITYGKSYARWADMELSAATTVSGSEARTVLETGLPWPCNEKGHPIEPVINSPFGR